MYALLPKIAGLLLAIAPAACVADASQGMPVETATTVVSQTAPTADAADQYTHHYYVYYRCAYHGWRTYGCYDCPLEAQDAAYALRQRSYETKIVCRY